MTRLAEEHPDLAYIHLVQPGLSGTDDKDIEEGEVCLSLTVYQLLCLRRRTDLDLQSNDFIRKIWLPRTLISAGRYTRETAIERAEETGELIAFGRRFLANVRRRCTLPNRSY